MRVFRIAAVVAFFCAGGLFAQNTRSFVSAVSGSDTNNCTRPTPCRTFNVALGMTNAGGEVIALESGGYGPFSVTKAVSIESPAGIYAGLGATTGDAISVNAGASDHVTLRGLTIVVSSTGNGINFFGGGQLVVQRCSVRGGSSGVILNGAMNLTVLDSSISDTIGLGFDAAITASAASGAARVTVEGCSFSGNQNGIVAASRSLIMLSNSSFESTLHTAAYASSGDSSNSIMVIENCRFSHSVFDAIETNSNVSQGFGTVYISNSTITGSGNVGLQQSNGGVIYSRGNNTIQGNTIDTFGTINPFAGK